MKKLLKFDIIHPSSYLDKKKTEWPDLKTLSLEAYRERLIKLRSNYSDYYTYHLNQSNEWIAEEFFLLDPDFIEKVANKILGAKKSTISLEAQLRKLLLRRPNHFEYKVIDAYIEYFKPDVIFVRSQPLPSSFWQKYRNRCLVVARLSARLPKQWHPDDWDLIYTDQPDFKTFFELHGTQTILNNQGFDQRINSELQETQTSLGCTFVGGLGTHNFSKRTAFMNEIAQKTAFKWWGYWWDHIATAQKLEVFPSLKNTYMGSTSGLEMYQIYKDSTICLNDYVDTANGIGFNQRMFEVMGVGGFLLTREATNFKKHFPENIFVTYSSLADCLEKIDYYTHHEKERKEIAAAGKRFVAEQYNYQEIADSFSKDLQSLLSV